MIIHSKYNRAIIKVCEWSIENIVGLILL